MSRLRERAAPLTMVAVLITALAVIVLSVVFAYSGGKAATAHTKIAVGRSGSVILVVKPKTDGHPVAQPLNMTCTPQPQRAEPDISDLTIRGECAVHTKTALKCTFGIDNLYVTLTSPMAQGGEFVLTISIPDYVGPGRYDAEVHASIGGRLLPVQVLWSNFETPVTVDKDHDMVTFDRPAVLDAEVGTGAAGTETISGSAVCSEPT